tara:strand:- start:899 stop:1087 length:189 start_codon:yes stop_codon:yes gene_type:complete
MEVIISAVTIILLRLADQSLGNIRALLVSKNRSFYAALIGLIESGFLGVSFQEGKIKMLLKS